MLEYLDRSHGHDQHAIQQKHNLRQEYPQLLRHVKEKEAGVAAVGRSQDTPALFQSPVVKQEAQQERRADFKKVSQVH